MVVCSLEGTYAQGSMDDGVLHMLNQNRHHWPPHVTQRCGVFFEWQPSYQWSHVFPCDRDGPWLCLWVGMDPGCGCGSGWTMDVAMGRDGPWLCLWVGMDHGCAYG